MSKGYLQCLDQLSAPVETLSDLFTLAGDGMLPSLRWLRVRVRNAVTKTFANHNSVKNIRFSQLRRFDLDLQSRFRAKEGERPVDWLDLAALISPVVTPCLERCSFIYRLSIVDDIVLIADAPVFIDDTRHVRMEFVMYSNPASIHDVDEATLRKLCFGRAKSVVVDYVSIRMIFDECNVGMLG